MDRGTLTNYELFSCCGSLLVDQQRLVAFSFFEAASLSKLIQEFEVSFFVQVYVGGETGNKLIIKFAIFSILEMVKFFPRMSVLCAVRLIFPRIFSAFRLNPEPRKNLI